MASATLICPTCRTRWPGHSRCPECGAELVVLKTFSDQARVERLPQFEDLARQFELGRRSGPDDPNLDIDWMDEETLESD